MYSTCLFCHSPLGRNESLEHFPIARRIAYDSTRGRVWAICRRCERWNLSPLETRWEAIEEAERAFHGTPLRVATDNIGLARLNEGLELVRVGKPPRLELAGWRYGDQFGRRYRRQLAVGTVMTVAGVAMYTTQIAAQILGFAAVGAVGSSILAAAQWTYLWQMRRDARRVRFVVRGDDGSVLGLTRLNVRCAALVPSDGPLGWRLNVRYLAGENVVSPRAPSGGMVRHRGFTGETFLGGRDAQRALSIMLPYLNRGGAGRNRVREAVDVIGTSATVDHLLHESAVNTEARRSLRNIHLASGESNVGVLPARLRLALEMVLHENDERRALEGELAELEARWRDAETIAKIADDLLLPSDLGARIEDIKRRDV
jgi:hypothetical protein